MGHNPIITSGSIYLAISSEKNPAMKRCYLRRFFVNIGLNLCNKCNTVFKVNDFYSDKCKSSGFSNSCKICNDSERKIYFEKNIDSSKESKKANYERTKDKVKEKQKIYYEKNKEIILQRNKDYFNKNKQKVMNVKKEYIKNNKEKITTQKRELKRARYKSDPVYRLKRNVCRAIHASITRNGYTKRSKTYKILGCSMDEFKIHIERQFTKGMSWDKIGPEIHIDHIVPLASAKTESEIIALNHYTNLRPCWAGENIRKSDSMEFLI